MRKENWGNGFVVKDMKGCRGREGRWGDRGTVGDIIQYRVEEV